MTSVTGPRRQPVTEAEESETTGLEDARCAIRTVRYEESFIGLAALKVGRVLPLELFVQIVRAGVGQRPALPRSSNTTAGSGLPLPGPWRTYRCRSKSSTSSGPPAGSKRASGQSASSSRSLPVPARRPCLPERCQQGLDLLGQVVASSLHDIEVVPADQEELEELVRSLNGETVEFCRRIAESSPAVG